jgi:hypothetical protein
MFMYLCTGDLFLEVIMDHFTVSFVCSEMYKTDYGHYIGRNQSPCKHQVLRVTEY